MDVPSSAGRGFRTLPAATRVKIACQATMQMQCLSGKIGSSANQDEMSNQPARVDDAALVK
jgi:hypothetical protein